MSIHKMVTVGGGQYKLLEKAVYDPHVSRYTAVVEHPNGTSQKVYSRFPEGPFAFILPKEQS